MVNTYSNNNSIDVYSEYIALRIIGIKIYFDFITTYKLLQYLLSENLILLKKVHVIILNGY